ncbi:hypothetical protein HYV10_01560 [Candidatus Dependentiae bacterium]|nr:hypothetical protein [Candidatus Dependentiae bacterium]
MIYSLFLLKLFISFQVVLLGFMLFHDWISIPPFNDIEAIRKNHSRLSILFSTLINSLCVAIPLYLTLFYFDSSLLVILCFYSGLTAGAIVSWWAPYFFGSSIAHKKSFSKFKNTHHFLPVRGDNVIPNSLHVVLHLFILACFALSLYFYFNRLSF